MLPSPELIKKMLARASSMPMHVCSIRERLSPLARSYSDATRLGPELPSTCLRCGKPFNDYDRAVFFQSWAHEDCAFKKRVTTMKKSSRSKVDRVKATGSINPNTEAFSFTFEAYRRRPGVIAELTRAATGVIKANQAPTALLVMHGFHALQAVITEAGRTVRSIHASDMGR